MGNYNESNVLASVLGCGTLDSNFLIDRLNEYDLDLEDVKDESEMIFGDKLNINELIYTTLYMGSNNFLAEVNNFFEEKELDNKIDKNILEDFDARIYTNFLDSGFDSKLSEYNLTDFSEENLQNFLQDLYNDNYLFLENDEVIEKLLELKTRIELETNEKEKKKMMQQLDFYASYKDDEISFKATEILNKLGEKEFNSIQFIDENYKQDDLNDQSIKKEKKSNYDHNYK